MLEKNCLNVGKYNFELRIDNIKQLQKSKKNKTVPESQIQREIKEYLQWKGWYVYKNHQSLGSHRGLFDLTAIKNGRVVWIEVKTEKGKLSEHQKRFMEEIKAHGGECMVARGINDVEHL